MGGTHANIDLRARAGEAAEDRRVDAQAAVRGAEGAAGAGHAGEPLAAVRVREASAPSVHATFPLTAAGEAHALMESGEHIGKIVLTRHLSGVAI